MVPATRLLALAAVVTLAGAPSACLSRAEPCAGVAVRPGDSLECPVPEWVDRGFDLEVPAGWDGRSPLPILFAFHGGGGNRRSAASVTCPDGKLDAPECLSAVAKAAGFALVRADGTGSRPVRNVRTWNAGGGVGPWNCTSGGACASGVDDVRFFDDLLAEVGRVVPVDPKRVHLTGLSNGAAISHRLACERPARVAPRAVQEHQRRDGAQRRHRPRDVAAHDAEHQRGLPARQQRVAALEDPPGHHRDHCRADDVSGDQLPAPGPFRNARLEQVDRDVLARQRGQRQAGEDHQRHRELGQLERAGQRCVEEEAADHVDRRDGHHEQDGHARERGEGPTERFHASAAVRAGAATRPALRRRSRAWRPCTGRPCRARTG